MVGGEVVQVIKRPAGTYIEVMEVPHSTSRAWRICDYDVDVEIGDRIWWQQWKGYLSRDGKYDDECIGSCKPAQHPDTKEGQ